MCRGRREINSQCVQESQPVVWVGAEDSESERRLVGKATSQEPTGVGFLHSP